MNVESLTNRQMNMLQKSELLTGLKREELIEFLSGDDVIMGDYQRGEDIFDRTRFLRSIAFILSGTATVYIPSASGQEMPMRKLNKGNFFGVATLFTEQKDYVSRIVAMTDIKVIFIGQETVEKMIRKEPAFSMGLIKFLSDRIRFLNTKISLLSNSNSMDSFVEYLVNMSLQSGNTFSVGSSYTLLAKSLNISRSSLYRNIEDLEEKGLIRREGKNITVPDISALTSYIL